MRLGFTRPALCAGALAVLAGCSNSNTSAPHGSSETVAVPARVNRRPRIKQAELDLANPLGLDDDATMLRSTPDYSITPTGESNLPGSDGLTIGGGVDSHTMLGESDHLLPSDDPNVDDIEVDITTDVVPTSLGSESINQY